MKEDILISKIHRWSINSAQDVIGLYAILKMVCWAGTVTWIEDDNAIIIGICGGIGNDKIIKSLKGNRHIIDAQYLYKEVKSEIVGLYDEPLLELTYIEFKFSKDKLIDILKLKESLSLNSNMFENPKIPGNGQNTRKSPV